MSCASSGPIFTDVGENMASPSSMWIDVANNKLYIVNSNSEVLYNWQQGSFQVYDITNPLAPSLLSTSQTLSYSGTIYFDSTSGIVYVPNRYSSNNAVVTDRMYLFNVSDSSAVTYEQVDAGQNAYAITCCYPDTDETKRAWITTSQNKLQYFDIGTEVNLQDMSLVTPLDNGYEMTSAQVNHIAIRDNQAFLSRQGGGVIIVNLDKAGVAGQDPVDYVISDIGGPEGIAVRDDILYVVGSGQEDGGWKNFLAIISVENLPPRTDNADAQVIDKNDSEILLALPLVGNRPQEVILSNDYAFVSNMGSNTVSVIDLDTREVTKTISVGQKPFSFALYTDGDGVERYLYVGNVESNTLSIIDMSTLEVVATY